MREGLRQKQSAAILCALKIVLPEGAIYISQRKNEWFTFSDEEVGVFYDAINIALGDDMSLMITFGSRIGLILAEEEADFNDAVEKIRSNSEAMRMFSLLAELSNEHCHYDEYWEAVMSEITFMDRESLEEKTNKLREIAHIFPNLAEETLIQGINKYYATK